MLAPGDLRCEDAITHAPNVARFQDSDGDGTVALEGYGYRWFRVGGSGPSPLGAAFTARRAADHLHAAP